MIWEPAIYEHKAALVGCTPTQVSMDSDLLAKAIVAEARTYEADFITVGIDVYNLEAEACGAELVETSGEAAAEIPRPLWSLEADFGSGGVPAEPDFAKVGRFSLVLRAAERARRELSTSDGFIPKLRIAASGPVSIASKLVGTEALLVAAAMEETSANRVLEFATRLCVKWGLMVRDAGFDVLVVDSSASPPLFSPDLYKTVVAPFHRQVMGSLRDSGQVVRPLIMGGNTEQIAAALVATGANSLICDFAADAAVFAAALAAAGDPDAASRAPLAIRRNVSPAAINDLARRDQVATQAVEDLAVLPGAILGTGILPYDQDPKTVLSFRDRVAALAT